MEKITAIKGIQLPKREKENRSDDKKKDKKEKKDVDLAPLKEKVEAAKAKLDVAENKLQEAQAELATAKEEYRDALAPYREACNKAGVECEFSGGRKTNVSERVRFLTEVTDKGVKVSVKDKPETEKLIGFKDLEESINRCAYDYTDTHIGPREEVGNKGGTLGNILRRIMRERKEENKSIV